MDNKKCWCYVTYAFSMDEVPPLPFPGSSGFKELSGMPAGFEPAWFLNAKFPEDEDN